MDRLELGDGVFPDTAIYNGVVYVAWQAGNTLHVKSLSGFAWTVPLSPDSEAFARFGVIGGKLWIAWRDGNEGKYCEVGNLAGVVSLGNVIGNAPIAIGDGFIAYQTIEPASDPRILGVVPEHVSVTRLRSEVRPTGISRITSTATAVFVDDDRGAVAGMFNPVWAGDLVAGEGLAGGAVVQNPPVTFWPGVDSFVPRISTDGTNYALATWGANRVRLAWFTKGDLTAGASYYGAPVPAPVPPAPAPAPAPTPAPAPVPAPVPEVPVPFSWQSLNIIGGSPDVRAWPETAAITALKFSATGLGVDFTKLDTWPDVTPPGWDGPIEYTIWVAEQIAGQWYATGALELWRSDPENGGNPFDADQIRKNWVFQASPMNAHTVVPGETIGIFVTSGGQRGGDVHQITERSNIVFVSFPSGPKTFTFTQLGPAPVDVVPAPAPVPASVPVPAPVPAPAPDPVITDSPLDVQLAQVHDQIAALQTTVNMLLGFVAEVPKVDPAPIIAALKALRFQATNKLLGTITLTEIG